MSMSIDIDRLQHSVAPFFSVLQFPAPCEFSFFQRGWEYSCSLLFLLKLNALSSRITRKPLFIFSSYDAAPSLSLMLHRADSPAHPQPAREGAFRAAGAQVQGHTSDTTKGVVAFTPPGM